MRWWRQPHRYVILDVLGNVVSEHQGEPSLTPAVRPLFLPYSDWDVPTPPQMPADQYEKRRTARALDQAFEIRARELRSYR